MKFIYIENQRFTQWWLWLVICINLVLVSYVFFKQLIRGIPVGTNPMPNAWVIFFTFLVVAIALFFWILELQTRITYDDILFRVYPLYRKRIFWDEIKTADVIQYDFVGYGLILYTKYGSVFNITGKWGLAIELHSGAKYLIGTQQPELLKTVVNMKMKRPVFPE